MQQPLFVLCPVQTFSSVVCAMLDMHPQMYGLPAVNLFVADDVGGLLEGLDAQPHALDGLLRVLAQLNEGEQSDDTVAAARDWLEQRRQWPTARVHEHIVHDVEPQIVVDRSPRLPRRAANLERAYAAYPEASFLHLTRHPRSSAHAPDETASADTGDPNGTWLEAHQNIVDFCDRLPLGQGMRLKAEDFIAHPDLYLPQICEWMDIDADPQAIDAMKHPERSLYARPGPAAAPLGYHPDFLANPALDAELVRSLTPDAGLEDPGDPELSQPALKLARLFGYS